MVNRGKSLKAFRRRECDGELAVYNTVKRVLAFEELGSNKVAKKKVEECLKTIAHKIHAMVTTLEVEGTGSPGIVIDRIAEFPLCGCDGLKLPKTVGRECARELYEELLGCLPVEEEFVVHRQPCFPAWNQHFDDFSDSDTVSDSDSSEPSSDGHVSEETGRFDHDDSPVFLLTFNAVQRSSWQP